MSRQTRREIKNIGGQAFLRGFEIEIKTINDECRRFNCSYSSFWLWFFWAFKIMSCTMGIVAWVGLLCFWCWWKVEILGAELLAWKNILAFALYVLSSAYVIPGLVVFIIIKIIFSSLCQWHACEHKLIKLLKSDLDNTLDNLRNISATSSRCGTYSFCSDFWGSLWVVLACFFVNGIWLAPVLAVGLALMYFAHKKRWGLRVQEFFCLAEPTEEQIQETFQLLQEVESWLFHKKWG